MIELDIGRFAYGDKVIFENASFSFSREGFTALTGASGSGKTTLLRLFSGLERGAELRSIDRSDISVVFQEPRLFEGISAHENASVAGDADEAKKLLIRFGMGDSLDKKPSELSGGMKVRVAVVRALCSKRPFILLDEPFRALDAQMKETVFSAIREKTQGGIIVTHDYESIKEHCTSLISL